MTTEQIRSACYQLDNTRIYAATKEAWYSPNNGFYDSYSLSCQPAPDGSECGIWYGKNFEDCLAQFERALLNPAPDNHE